VALGELRHSGSQDPRRVAGWSAGWLHTAQIGRCAQLQSQRTTVMRARQCSMQMLLGNRGLRSGLKL
jgi:hypothetical protein